MRIYAIKARFSGIYEWGVGWLSVKQNEAWDEYFEKLAQTKRPIFWGYYKRENAQYLVSTSGSVYLHPMSVVAYLQSNVVTKEMKGGVWVEVFGDVDELKEIMKGAAEACGGSVEFSQMAISLVKDPQWSMEQ